MEHFRLRRHGQPDLEFDGDILADVSSKDDEPDKIRWTEIRIYRSKSGKYIAEVVGKSRQEDERDRMKVTVLNDPAQFGQVLMVAGHNYLTDLALEAIEQACEADTNIVVTEKID